MTDAPTRLSSPHAPAGPYTALACVAVATCCFATIPIFLRSFTDNLNAWTVNGVRYSVAALFWLPYVLLSMRRMRRPGAEAIRHYRNVWRDAIVPAAANLAGQICWGLCPYYNDAATIGFGIRLSFLFTIVFGFALIPEERRLARSPSFLVGAAIGIGGVLMMFAERLADQRPGSLTGLAILVATTILWGVYGVTVRRNMGGYPMRLAFGVISLYTAAGLVVAMLVLGDYQKLPRLEAVNWMLLVVSAFLGIAFGHVLMYRGIHGLGPVVTSGMQLAAPFLTFLLAATILNESMTVVQFIGGLAVVVCGALLVKARTRSDAAPPPARPAAGR